MERGRGRGGRGGGGSAKVSTERQRQVKDLRVATTPFALCVKRSEVNLAKVEGDGEREGRDKGRGGQVGMASADFTMCRN